MEDLGMKNFWHGKNVLLTGHTGFKGSWLSEVLLTLGANVTGCALEAKLEQDLFNLCKLQEKLAHNVVDVRDKEKLEKVFHYSNPDVVFHLAAQPLVLPSYEDPVTTWETNVMGSLNVLECLKFINKRCAVVMVTTDKVYEASNEHSPKMESDHLGGHDPYSSSKAAMELAVASWRNSFFSGSNIKIATARSGNVVGGGDWSNHRIIPSVISAINNKVELNLRNPKAIRPWQHVLDPLFGYLKLAQALYSDQHFSYQTSFNFGPDQGLFIDVETLVDTACEIWGIKPQKIVNTVTRHEASCLVLNSAKAHNMLNWKPKWNFNETIFHTVNWYKQFLQGDDAASLVQEQIDAYI